MLSRCGVAGRMERVILEVKTSRHHTQEKERRGVAEEEEEIEGGGKDRLVMQCT